MTRPPFVEITGDTAARVGDVDAPALQLVIDESIWERLQAHLFPGDGEEHAAVLAAGVVQTARGGRLLARELFLARDGVDFVAARRAHRRLTPAFVNDMIRRCRDEGLTYLAIHNHGHGDAVGFSSIDLASHERGYPALLDIARGQPVGALVLATEALAGDIWTPDGCRHPIGETVVLGRNMRRMYPTPSAVPRAASAIYDRQARIYGDAGQALLSRLKVGVIGAGGVGLPIVSAMARLGVGHLVVIDSERVELSNVPRLPESTRRDAKALLTASDRPHWTQRLGRRLATPKVELARRVAQRARRDITIDTLRGDVSDPAAAAMLIDCDYVFLAADTHLARAVFNALVFGFLIPGVQVGSKVEVDAGGAVADIFSVVRPVTPASGCLWCNGLISPARLTDELLPETVREAQRYLPLDDAPAPSVITLNGIGVAQATNHFLLAVTGLLRGSGSSGDYRRFEARSERLRTEIPRRDEGCPECGLGTASLRARGAVHRLPLRNA
ncbi:MAG: ThiF family adenylyltransferase [Solirubrobacteraceae bacterium]